MSKKMSGRSGSTVWLLGMTVVLFVAVLGMTRFVQHQMRAFFIQPFEASKMTEQAQGNNKAITKIQSLTRQDDITHLVSFYLPKANGLYAYTALHNNLFLSNPLYEDFVPTYQYYPLWIPNQTPDFIRKRDLLFQITNTRYYVTGLDKQEGFDPAKDLVTDIPGGKVFKLPEPLPYVFVPDRVVLLISDDTHHDFNSLKAKLLLFLPSFQVHSMSLYTQDKAKLEKVDFNAFEAIVVDEARPLSQTLINKLTRYSQSGGQVIPIHIQSEPAPDVRWRSVSMMTDSPVVSMRDQDNQTVAQLFSKPVTATPSAVTTQLLKQTPEYLKIAISTSRDVTPLQVADTFFPGWIAKVDNKTIPIYMADSIMKGVIITGKGDHILELRYVPFMFYAGLTISVLTLITIIFVLKHRLNLSRA